MTFEGSFKPPIMGHAQKPFPISGDGACDVDDRCLTVIGFRPPSAGLRFVIMMVGLTLAVTVAAVAASAGVSQRAAIGIAFAVFIAAALLPLPGNKKRPAQFRIPWAKIKRARVQQNVLLVSVKRFRPEGEIHFTSPQCRALLAEIQRRLAQ